ncbi:hypothetical protein O4H52_21350 [Sphingomonadaceae bacterium G21617-S1]|nr:hypothetical protein [Sphingomonadaceae bacterium G21617-S1]
MIIQGRVWKFTRDISATDLVAARHDKIGMGRDWAACAKLLLEDVDADFAGQVHPGDILIVAGTFGLGHAHYYNAGIQGLRHAGVSAVFANNLNGLFFRSSTDLGLKTWRYPDIVSLVKTGDEIRLDLSLGSFENLSTGQELEIDPVPQLIRDIFIAEGSSNWALRQVGAA